MKSFIWTSQEAKTLGILFTKNISDRISINLDNKLDEMYLCLNKWENHNLTLLGSIAVIKTFALSHPDTLVNNRSALWRAKNVRFWGHDKIKHSLCNVVSFDTH